MPTPVPLKILTRRDQRTRLGAVLLVALGTGIAAHAVRPYFTGPPHPEAIGSLVILTAACIVLLLGLRRMSYARAAVVYVIEDAALWIVYCIGWIIAGGGFLAEVVAISAAFCVATASLGLLALAVIQRRWPPRRLLTCPSCDYGLKGLTRSACPECGHAFEARCAACGRRLTELASDACPDCRAALTIETVLVS